VIACPHRETKSRALSLLPAVMSVAAALMAPLAAHATTIQRVVSPGGIEAWLVQDPSVPLIAFDFSFRGGANQDPVDKPGVATMTASLLDEGAGEFDSRSFHERIEAKVSPAA
jgi:zinc protease